MIFIFLKERHTLLLQSYSNSLPPGLDVLVTFQAPLVVNMLNVNDQLCYLLLFTT